MLTRRTVPNKREQRRLHRSLHRWQAAFCALYAALFALVMPFLCMGAVAQPGHPHRFPHFVFVDPQLVDTNLLVVNGQPTSVLGKASHHLHLPSASHDHAPTPTQPAGRAAPTLLLFMILAPLVLNAWGIAPNDQRHFVTLHDQPFPTSISLTIPLPPPRHATLLH